ncbi:MAG: 4-phosphoerythronate dehydrogenase [Alistipes sp.]|nr:4-phosphoerythronate dehydrogenase [Alistipes sp.]
MTQKPHIVADCAIPFLQGTLEPYATVDYLQGSAITHDDLRKADALIVRTRTRCDAAMLEGTPVRLIATATIGYDHIDSTYCAAHGIEVVTAAGCNARGVLQYVMAALALCSLRDHWSPTERCLGVIGVGHVGKLVALFGEHFGFKVLCCDPPRAARESAAAFVTQEELLSQADIVTCHVPLLREGPHPTFHMAGARFFDRMRQGSLFINSSRGEVVEDEALIHALQAQKLSHAIIDTWNHEPAIDPTLHALCTYGTPHIAGYSLQGKAAGTAAVVRALSRHFGWPLTQWYPSEVTPTRANLDLTWEELLQRMPQYFDLEQESLALRNDPSQFEALRNHYTYRTEFF